MLLLVSMPHVDTGLTTALRDGLVKDALALPDKDWHSTEAQWGLPQRQGGILESDLVAEQELASGRLVSPLRHVCNSVRYVGHYLVHPRRHRQAHAVTQFKHWLFKELAAH